MEAGVYFASRRIRIGYITYLGVHSIKLAETMSAVGRVTGGAAVHASPAVAGATVIRTAKMRLAVLISGQLVRLYDAQFDALASLPTAHVHIVLSRVR